MSESPHKLLRFWQELKRRKVFSVVTTYAATAYIIIEVVNNLIGPLHLPDWLATLVVILLIIGLPVAIILSWVFDFTPKGIIKTESLEELQSKEIIIKPVKRKLRASYVLNAILVVVVLILAYPKVFKRDTLENLRAKGKISVAVMPFQNMTGDTTKNLWKNWIQDNLIAYLSNSEELKVKQMESIKGVIQGKGLTENASITPSLASAISQTLDANVFIYGSINQSDTVLRVNTKLIDSKTEEIFKSFQIDGNVKKILSIIDSLSKMVKDFLVLSKFEKETPLAMKYLTTTASPEAYQYFMFGNNAFSKGDFPASIKLFSQALAIDSNLTFANILIAYAYGNQGFSDEARKYILRIYRKRDMMPQRERIWTNYAHAEFFETPNESIRYLRQLQELDDQVPNVYGNLGGVYFITHQYDNSIIELRKGLEIYKKWNAKPFWSNDYSFLGMAYYKTGQNKKAKEVFEKGEQDFPYASDIPYYKSILLLNEGDSIGADKSMKKFISLYKEWSASEADITTGLAEIYSEAGIPEKAEIFFRQALSLEPENPVRLKNLAYFLIDKNLNVNEGMELIDKALELNPDSMSYFKFIFTDCKGWGLFRQGKHKEALEILKKNWDERPDYNHDAFLHLEAAKKAVAALK